MDLVYLFGCRLLSGSIFAASDGFAYDCCKIGVVGKEEG